MPDEPHATDPQAIEPGAGAPIEPERGPEATFRAYLDGGRLMLQRARGSGAHVFYPRVAEPGTGDRDLEWVEASGLATVYATTIVRRRAEKGGPYNVALVDLDEGVRCMSRIEDVRPEDVRIGQRVRARIDRDDGAAVLVFVPAQSGGGDADAT